MKHYTFKLYLQDGDSVIEGGAVGSTFEEALEYFKAQPEVITFISQHGAIVRTELISEEAPKDATPEAAHAKGMETLARATSVRIAGDHRIRIGMELMEARVDYGLSVEAAAVECGIKPATIRNIESGRFNADIDLLSRIAECYDCEIGVCEKNN